MRLLLALIIYFCSLIASPLYASDDTREAQKILNELGYDAGTIDGVLGKKTEHALNEFYSKISGSYDGTIDINEITDLKLALKTRKLSNQNIKQIMIGDAKNGYEFNDRNVSKKNSLHFVLHQGMPSAKITLHKSMKGHKDDWYRSGEEGFAQRFEYGENKRKAQVLNKEIWTRLLFWLPKNTILEPNGQSVTLFDLKEVSENQTYGPVMALEVKNEWSGTVIKMKHHFEKNDCIIGSDGKDDLGNNSFCDKIDANVIIGPISKFTMRWVEFVSHAIWSGENSGRYNAWIDGEKIMGYHGPTISIADKVAFKFGVYRRGLNKKSNPNDFEIYYSKVGTGNKCEILGSNYCDKIKKSLELIGYPNIQKIERYESNEKTDFIKGGGTVLRVGN